MLIGKRITQLPPFSTRDKETLPQSLDRTIKKRIRYLESLRNHFWKRWREEYLGDLREQHKVMVNKETSKQIRQGDVVLIVDINTPGNTGSWER